MSGYVNCGCRDCFEVTVGEPGEFCTDCEEAGCEEDSECCADGAYGTDTAWTFCDKCKTHIDPDADNGTHECSPDHA